MGYITQAIIVNFMPVLFAVFQDKFKISFTQLGSLMLINFAAQLVVDVIAARYVDRIGFRKSAVPAHFFCVMGLVSLSVLPNILPNPYLGLVISVLIMALGGGLIEVVVSPIVDALPNDDDSAAMSLLHSFYCWGQLAVILLSTLVIKVFGYGAWGVLSLLWSVIPLWNIFNFMRVPLPETMPEERKPIRNFLKSGGFILGLLLMFGSGAAEQVMAQWASLFAQRGLGVPKIVGDLLGPCIFALLMAIGRMWYGIKGDSADLRKVLLASSGLCVVCYIVAAFSLSPVVSLAACALTGISVCLMWPGTLSFISERYPGGGAAIFGIMAIFGDLGCSVGSWIAGAVSDAAQKLPIVIEIANKYNLQLEQAGLKAGILTGTTFPIILILGLIILKEEKRGNER